MTRVVIVGAGDLARLARAFFAEAGVLDVVGCAVDAAYLDGAALGELPVVAFEELERHFPPGEHEAFVAVGYRRVNAARADLCRRARAKGYRLATFVHPRAYVAPEARLGDNCIVFPGAVIEPFAALGDDVVVWSGAVIAHDTIVGDDCFFGPNASVSGKVTIGRGCFVGLNATLRDGISLGDGTVVGAGAVVKHDTRAGEVFPAVPTPVGPRSSDSYDDL